MFYDFIVFMGFFFVMLTHGAVANDIDCNFIEVIIQLANDAILVKQLAQNEHIYEKDGEI